jgi:large subunit ribosomal protein L15
MKIHELNVTPTTDRKRVGRGIGSGTGKTAGRGTKGQNARTGGGVRPGFEGGQNPLAKRLPKKRGFSAVNRLEYQIVNLSSLSRLGSATVVDASVLKGAGLISSATRPVKLLANGETSAKLTLKVNAASASAKAAIEKAGGTVEIVPLPKVASKKPTRVKTEEQG